VAGQSQTDNGSGGETPAGRLAREAAAQHAAMLGRIREELGGDTGQFAEAAQRLAVDFGSVTATAVDAAYRQAAGDFDAALADRAGDDRARPRAPEQQAAGADEREEARELASLYRPGHMRRRLEQLVETNRRYGHPFALAVFDASGPDARDGSGDPERTLAVVGAALRDSVRIVDETFQLEEDAICVLAPNLRTVEAMRMAERLLALLDELERAGGPRIATSAGVVACPEHGNDADQLLHKADTAMWRARAVGQPVGVGSLQDR
jgi:diguanylate cyclase (GGDEF)-like protein